MQVEIWPVSRPIPYARNARKIPQKAIDKVAASIKEFGWKQPIVVDSKDVIIAGHTRLLAAHKLALSEVPVHVATDLSPAQVKAYRLMDNRSHQEAEWDIDLLGPEMLDLKELGIDLDITGFDDNEIANFLAKAEATPGLTDDDAVPEAPEHPVTVLGDLWVLGRHRLLCGDATSIDAVERLMGGEKADMVFTDPPYGVNFERGKFVGRDKAARGEKYAPIANDELKGQDLTDFITEALSCAYAVSKDVPVYVWSPSLDEGMAILAGVRAAGFKVQSQIIWRKWPFVIGRADYHWQHEVCWYGFKGKNHPWYGGRDKATVWDVKKAQSMDLHPTMKPVELSEIAVNNSSKGGDAVLDLFGGSGSTLIACEKTGRNTRMMEIDPKYCDVIINRWQDYTGKQATLEGDGRTFAEIKSERFLIKLGAQDQLKEEAMQASS